MSQYKEIVREHFSHYADSAYAEPMQAYMKYKFPFFGIPTPKRKKISQALLKEYSKLPMQEIALMVKDLWEIPQRELQYFAMELLEKVKNKLPENAIELIQYLILEKSWWDSVDKIASHLAGAYFKSYPKHIPGITGQWIQSENIWLQRSALLFQLKYKEETDSVLLFKYIDICSQSKEFFIQKAIGWVLREQSKTDKDTIRNFMASAHLSPLSIREAGKYL